MDSKLLNLRLQAERRTVQPDHDLMLWAVGEIERLRAALVQVREVCDDNAAAACNQAMALAFVRSVAAETVGQSAK